MTTNSTHDGAEKLQEMAASLKDGRRGLDVIRRVEAGGQGGDGTITLAKYGESLLVSLLDTGELWLMDNVEAMRMLAEARKFSPQEAVALYRFFWDIALAEIITFALTLKDEP